MECLNCEYWIQDKLAEEFKKLAELRGAEERRVAEEGAKNLHTDCQLMFKYYKRE